MRKSFDFGKSGLFALGYVGDKSPYLSYLSKKAKTIVSEADFARNIEAAYDAQKEINYSYNTKGNLHQGAFDERTCLYAIDTGFIEPNANPAYPDANIFAVFKKDIYGSWSFVKFFTKYRIEKLYNAYRIGNISFKDYAAANKFIADLHDILLPGEVWQFGSNSAVAYRPKTKYDILENYLKNVFEKLLCEYNLPDSGNYNKIIFSDDKKYALFNSGLLDKFAEDVYLLGEVFWKKPPVFNFSNPIVAGSLADLGNKYKFGESSRSKLPDVVKFFDKVDDIIYDPNVVIDMSRDKLEHIIVDGVKRNRYKERYMNLYKDKKLPLIHDALTRAIDKAKKIAKRNYKYVVPQYRSASRGEPGKIQLLMPIYLDGEYDDRPDFALVLNSVILQENSRLYIPETILELPWAYNNARVICKPEDTWLNPKTMESPLIELDMPE